MIGRLFTYTTPDHFPRTVTGRPAVYRSEADLDAALAARKGKRPVRSQASRLGWRTRRKFVLGSVG